MTWDYFFGLRLPEVRPLVDFRLLTKRPIVLNARP